VCRRKGAASGTLALGIRGVRVPNRVMILCPSVGNEADLTAHCNSIDLHTVALPREHLPPAAVRP
jgi:hypothetical protein